MGSTVAQPDTTFALASADVAVENSAQKVLIVGQMTGTAVPDGSWHQNVDVAYATANFGQTSRLTEDIRAAKRITDRVQVDVIALRDAGGAAARVVDVPITGPATEAGTIFITVGSERYFRFAVPVSSGDSAATIAASAVAVINADPTCPYTAAVAAAPDRVTLTSDNAGALANQDPIEIEGTVGGVGFGTIANGTAGATDPTLTTILDVINDERYQWVVWPYADDLAPIATLLNARFNATNAIRDGMAVVPVSDSFGDHITRLQTAVYNSNSVMPILDEEISDGANGYVGPALAERSEIKGVYTAMIAALRLTPDVAISQYVTTKAALDQFGGPGRCSLPFFNTPYPHLPTPKPGRGFTESEIEQLLAEGGGIIGQNPAGSAAIAGELPTSYLTDPAGNPDVSWKFANYRITASVAREYFHNNFRARFGQSRLTQGTVTAGLDMANEDVIKGFLVRLYGDLSGPVYSALQAGPEALAFFKNSITVAVNLAQGKATITCKLPILTQLRTIQATVNIAFDITIADAA